MEPKPGRAPKLTGENAGMRLQHSYLMDSIQGLPREVVFKVGEKTESEDTRAIFVESAPESDGIDLMTQDGAYRITTTERAPRGSRLLDQALMLAHNGFMDGQISGSYSVIHGKPFLKVKIKPAVGSETEYGISPGKKAGYAIKPITIDEFSDSIQKSLNYNRKLDAQVAEKIAEETSQQT